MSDEQPPKGTAFGRDQVVQIINSVIDKVQKTDFAAKDALFQELYDLKDVIDEARTQIGSAKAGDIRGIHIPAATDELDAIVGATEEATGTIMDCCELIQQNLPQMSTDVSATVESEVMKIFEACSFQDITGQRIKKVVTTLKTIEEKVAKILLIMEKIPGADVGSVSADVDTRTGTDRLLNGPQLPGQGVAQDEIDRLLAEFDK